MNRDVKLTSPVPNEVESPTAVQNIRVDRELAIFEPVESYGFGVSVIRQSVSDDLDATIDVLPLAVVDISVLVYQGRVIPVRVEGLSDGAQAVRIMEDAQCDDVVVLLPLKGGVLCYLRQLFCHFPINTDPLPLLVALP